MLQEHLTNTKRPFSSEWIFKQVTFVLTLFHKLPWHAGISASVMCRKMGSQSGRWTWMHDQKPHRGHWVMKRWAEPEEEEKQHLAFDSLSLFLSRWWVKRHKHQVSVDGRSSHAFYCAWRCDVWHTDMWCQEGQRRQTLMLLLDSACVQLLISPDDQNSRGRPSGLGTVSGEMLQVRWGAFVLQEAAS